MEKSNSRLWIGLVFILFGGLLVFRNMGLFYFDLFSWPVLLIIIGLVILINSRNSFSGWFLIVLGGLWLASRYYHFSMGDLIHDYWPVILILLGLLILFKRDSHTRKEKNKNGADTDADFIDATSIFNDVKTYAVSKNFKGGKLTTIFGSSKLDAVRAELAVGHQILDVLTIFGGIDLRVPSEWDVNIKVTSIFGGFEDKRRVDPNLVKRTDKSLVIKGLVIFGGGEISG